MLYMEDNAKKIKIVYVTPALYMAGGVERVLTLKANYFAEHFPMVYTRKYWMKEASELRTEWAGKRIYQPSRQPIL